MFDQEWVDDLDAGGACEAISAAHRDLVEVECRQLLLAAQWLDLHAPVEEPDAPPASPVRPGRERWVRAGADGTAQISEFACAEFAALQELHPRAGATLLGKVANLRHRHPLLWARVRRGEVRGWKALEVARITAKTEYALCEQQARWVDAQTHEWVTTLGWGEFLCLLEAKIIACDPDGAEARRDIAAAERFVATGRSNEYGLKTLIAKAGAGEILYLTAVVDRIAQILADQGNPGSIGARRAAGLCMLARPAEVLTLLADTAAQADADTQGHADTDTDASADPAAGPAAGRGDDSGADSGVDQEPEPEPGPDEPEQYPCPTCTGHGTVAGDPAAFVKPTWLDHIDLSKLLPAATLYIHLSEQGFFTRTGVCRVEGVGPITVDQASEFLRHRNVTVLPVKDLTDQHPVTGYEFPATLREQVLLTNPTDVFPWAVGTSRTCDLDHPNPYLDPGSGGPPGQTHPGNAAPLIRFHHRIKTHANGWALRQPEPGSYLWRSPHGYYWLTGHTGTHPLTTHIGQHLWDTLDTHHTDTDQATGHQPGPLASCAEPAPRSGEHRERPSMGLHRVGC